MAVGVGFEFGLFGRVGVVQAVGGGVDFDGGEGVGGRFCGGRWRGQDCFVFTVVSLKRMYRASTSRSQVIFIVAGAFMSNSRMNREVN